MHRLPCRVQTQKNLLEIVSRTVFLAETAASHSRRSTIEGATGALSQTISPVVSSTAATWREGVNVKIIIKNK